MSYGTWSTPLLYLFLARRGQGPWFCSTTRGVCRPMALRWLLGGTCWPWRRPTSSTEDNISQSHLWWVRHSIQCLFYPLCVACRLQSQDGSRKKYSDFWWQATDAICLTVSLGILGPLFLCIFLEMYWNKIVIPFEIILMLIQSVTVTGFHIWHYTVFPFIFLDKSSLC